MAEKQEKHPTGGDQESEVWSAIAAFEQILEAIPNDRTSLATLAHAYEQIGDLARAKDYTVRLADIVLGEADHQEAKNILPKLALYAVGDAAAEEALKRLQAFVETAGDVPGDAPRAEGKEKDKKESRAVVQSPAAKATASGRTSFNIANELPLAWNLLKANELTQEEYSNVVQDLTELFSTDAAVTVSVLHVLHDRSFKNLPKVLARLAKDCGTPIIAISNFELQPEAFSLLPLDFIVKRGVVLFDFFGDAALAVILNPYDKELMKDVEHIAGRKCFFYLTPPAEFDHAVGKLRAWFEGKEHA
jgi:hypothetical protein